MNQKKMTERGIDFQFAPPTITVKTPLQKFQSSNVTSTFFATILKLDHSWPYYLTRSIQFPIMARYTQRLQDDEVKQIDIDNVDEDGCRYSSGVNHLIQLWGTTSFFAPMLNVRAIFEYAMEAVSRHRSLSNQMSQKIIPCAMALHLETASMGIFVECSD